MIVQILMNGSEMYGLDNLGRVFIRQEDVDGNYYWEKIIKGGNVE